MLALAENVGEEEARFFFHAPLGRDERRMTRRAVAVPRDVRVAKQPSHHSERRRDRRVAAIVRRGRAQMLLRLGELPLLEEDVPHPLSRADVAGREAEHHVPLVEGVLELAAIHADAREQIVRVRVVRVALESAMRDLEPEVELAGAPQRLAQLHEHEARRIARELVAQPSDLVRHRCAPAAGSEGGSPHRARLEFVVRPEMPGFSRSERSHDASASR